ncbi:hypothetical protein FDP41_007962 [Naegleria fowleri]|uniref:HMG box domain-containing protein n=1 Tax=Naegleria fowleri TaxID=5763 RepID=A0A6A5C3X6_NAEFO|nr:uncharacterized protein FDP41_007962 [Naegleria fowleri]KAF0984047.1 hypothetical protein FDP41_007962 [Naegleria fowleri]CAG4717032.1 unnamed protein product [Naegleria fowleri]
MEYVLEALTRAPSQVLVKSASQFGEEAAKVLGACIEESLKNCTDDITTSIRENINSSGKKMSKEMDKYSQVLKETVVEGFAEWGIGIERAFYHLGHKLENGLNNTANRLAVQLDQSVDQNMSRIDSTIRDSITVITKDFMKEQIPYWRASFMRELNIILICLCVITAGVFSLCMSWALGGYQVFTHILTQEFRTLCFLFFSILMGFSLFIWNKAIGESKTAKTSEEEIVTSTPTIDTHDSSTLEHENVTWMKKIISEQQKYYQNNPQFLLIIVACLGFFMGDLARDVFISAFSPSSGASSGVIAQIFDFVSSWLYLLLILSVMIFVTIVVNKIIAIEVVLKIYSIWREYLKFREFLKQDKGEEIKATPTNLQDNKKKEETISKKTTISVDVQTQSNPITEDTMSDDSQHFGYSNRAVPKTKDTKKSHSTGHILPENSSLTKSDEPVRKASSGDLLGETFVDTESDDDELPTPITSSRGINEPSVSSTSFILFCKENRPRIAETNPELTFFEVRKKLEEMWRSMSSEEKQPYETRAKEMTDQL